MSRSHWALLYPCASPQVSFWRPFWLALHASELQRLPTIGRKNDAPGLKPGRYKIVADIFSRGIVFIAVAAAVAAGRIRRDRRGRIVSCGLPWRAVVLLVPGSLPMKP